MHVRDRLKALVEQHFRGNVNQAARKWGVPQPTLYRYLQATGPEPKARHLQSVAEFYGATVDWLLTGRGWNPLEADRGFIQWRDWDRLVATLELPPEVDLALRAMPNCTNTAYSTLVEWGDRYLWGGARVNEERLAQARETARRAHELEVMAWTEWLVGLTTAFGKARVRLKLIENVGRIRLGFQSLAMYLLDTRRLSAKKAERAFEDLHPPQNPPRVTALLNSPKSQPLALHPGAVRRRYSPRSKPRKDP